MVQITFITGGARSGKSSFAQKMAESQSESPVYLATARVWDEDFRQRIERHQNDRGPHWTNIEQEKELSACDVDDKTVLLDCITLWLTNIFFDNQFDADRSLKEAKTEWDRFVQKKMNLIVVSNELGMGVHPVEEAARKFADLQGWMNQFIAQQSSKVFLMISGIPVKIKG
ncbi:MAG: bifunctional adenosylcobinamide kinase/adenosylcobinamide-phosphate guanylyltransferase [Bacteroidetes bacterium]|nr:bifunctional adenosylcobinamide kinase/adenosylcobinamide-phosphate guanylyltransferase [Bacteroidota bacterium]MCL6103498.1 bifunctional adenosylcobinamide kinase/adenosylcobinamide-phosphate guanylyltransferase [Bacteroidota bacterium]